MEMGLCGKRHVSEDDDDGGNGDGMMLLRVIVESC